MMQVDWQEIASELRKNAPLLWIILNEVAGTAKKTKRNHDCALSFLAAGLLFYRNQRLSRLQYIIGIILDNSGATDEVR